MPRGGARPGAGRKPSPERVAIIDEAKKFGPEMLRILAGIARDKKAPAAARTSAADSLLNRAYGRPAQALHVPEETPSELMERAYDLSKLTEEQLLALEAIALQDPEGDD